MGSFKFALGVFFFVFQFHASAFAQTVQIKIQGQRSSQTTSLCTSTHQIKTHIDEFRWRMWPLIKEVPYPLLFEYSNTGHFPIGGYGYFSDINKVTITIYGDNCSDGLIGNDEFDLLLCHELGHAAGGTPYMEFTGNPQLINVSAEGQADFFATSSCMPTLYAMDNNIKYLENLKDYPELAAVCTDPDGNKRGMCVRIGIASLHFAQSVYAPMSSGSHMALKDPGAFPSLSGKDPMITNHTYLRQYPTAQCRLETYLAGVRCQAVNTMSNYSLTDSAVTCANSAAEAPRPSCWYKN